MKTTKFIHNGDLGDIVFSIPSIIAKCGILGTEPHLVLCPMPEAKQPTREVMTKAKADFISPVLLKAGISVSFEQETPSDALVNFPKMREQYRRDESLVSQYAKVAEVSVDASSKWLEVEPSKEASGLIVVARSRRYRNPIGEQIYRSLPMSRCAFIGHNDEHEDFEIRFGKIKRLGPFNDAMEIASVIRGCSEFIGNQSFPASLAEAMKVNRTIEVSTERPDTVCGGGSVHYFSKSSVRKRKENVMPMLQFWDGDMREAYSLARIITDNAIKMGSIRDEFALCIRDDVEQKYAEEIAQILSAAFRKIHIIRSTRSGRGWPAGCNDLWQSSMQQISRLKKARVIKSEAVFTFEPDGIPLRCDWLDVIDSEWEVTKSMGKICFGTVHDVGIENNRHINGNAVFHCEITSMHKELQLSKGPWDLEHRKKLLSVGRDSFSIIQRYGVRSAVPEDEILGIRKQEQVPAWLHGIKTDSARDAIRKQIDSGEFYRTRLNQ